jgi:hypothetical protein
MAVTCQATRITLGGALVNAEFDLLDCRSSSDFGTDDSTPWHAELTAPEEPLRDPDDAKPCDRRSSRRSPRRRST